MFGERLDQLLLLVGAGVTDLAKLQERGLPVGKTLRFRADHAETLRVPPVFRYVARLVGQGVKARRALRPHIPADFRVVDLDVCAATEEDE